MNEQPEPQPPAPPAPPAPPSTKAEVQRWVVAVLCWFATIIHFVVGVVVMLPLHLLAGILVGIGKGGEYMQDVLEDVKNQLHMVLGPRSWQAARQAMIDAKDYEGRFRFFVGRTEALHKEVEFWKAKASGEAVTPGWEGTAADMPTLALVDLPAMPPKTTTQE